MTVEVTVETPGDEAYSDDDLKDFAMQSVSQTCHITGAKNGGWVRLYAEVFDYDVEVVE